MENANEGHLSDEALEGYSLERLDETDGGPNEEHLLVCDFCRTRLEAIEPFNFIHFTEAGTVHLRATRLMTGKVMARRWSSETVACRIFESVSAAKCCLEDSFARLYPEHECDRRCGPAQENPV